MIPIKMVSFFCPWGEDKRSRQLREIHKWLNLKRLAMEEIFIYLLKEISWVALHFFCLDASLSTALAHLLSSKSLHCFGMLAVWRSPLSWNYSRPCVGNQGNGWYHHSNCPMKHALQEPVARTLSMWARCYCCSMHRSVNIFLGKMAVGYYPYITWSGQEG
jgi:hypothetical protein